MLLSRIPWECPEHGASLRLVVLSLYLLGEISSELGDLWEISGQPRPDGFREEFKGAQFVIGHDRTGFYFSDRCFIPMESVLSKEAV